MNRHKNCRHDNSKLRPPSQPSVRLTLDVPLDEWETLERAAKKYGSTPQQLVEGAIASRLAVCLLLLEPRMEDLTQ